MFGRHSKLKPGTGIRLRYLLLAPLSIGLLLAAGAFGFGSGNLLATVTKPEPEKKPEKRPCCAIGIAYIAGGGKVTLTQVCNTKGRSIFHFQTHGVGSACTHPPGTVLRDQRGRRYPMIAAFGLPDCKTGQFSQTPDLKFRWEFQQLKPDVTEFTLLEVEDEVTSGLSFWAWRNIDVSHCKFQ